MARILDPTLNEMGNIRSVEQRAHSRCLFQTRGISMEHHYLHLLPPEKLMDYRGTKKNNKHKEQFSELIYPKILEDESPQCISSGAGIIKWFRDAVGNFTV